MLELRNLLNTKLNKKGFTLAELLVVVAIIAILVAVSIPIFTGKLGEAKEKTDLANERAAKAAAVTEYLSEDNLDAGYTGYYDANEGVMRDANTGIKAYSQVDDGKIIKVTIAAPVDATETDPAKDADVEVTWENAAA